ncbi:MAG: FlgD immunoglobulin-like domain containing protein [bacterium]
MRWNRLGSAFLLSFLTLNTGTLLFAQSQFPWPVQPFNASHEITGNFAEFRDTGNADHFHNGTDIPEPDGTAVYPVKDGVVTSIGTVSQFGSNAFLRVQDVAYVHIGPNPVLAVGDSVFASETVLGTILAGLGHVHFTNGFVGAEKNSMLPNSGFAALQDPWPPIIRFVRFFQNNTANEFPTNKLSDLVDIVVKVDEQNGPPTSRVSRRNNGTYKIGYKILSADTSTVVFEPPNGGVRFQFDTKPSNSHVHRVYFDQLSSTTSHVYIVSNDITRDNFWNTAALPVGRYVVMAFTEDTRHNIDTLYVDVETTDADLLPPAQPVLGLVKEIANGLDVNWFPNADEDLLGYRLYFSFDNVSWSLRSDESTLGATQVDTSFNAILNGDIYFRVTAVDNAPVPNQSQTSDVYGMSNGDFSEKVLIVDGFDRTDGSWSQPNHFFAFTHGRAIVANGFSFDTAANEAIVGGAVDLNDYRAVFWLLGDESTDEETFSSAEQSLVMSYLENGGMLFVSGSEIAWDLDQDNASSGSTPADEQFLHTYLKADYAADDSEILSATGVDGTIFEGVNLDYGVTPYPEDFPDVINPFGENVTINLKYSAVKNAGIQYAGTFGNGTTPGKLVYLAFPFETITGEETRNEVLARVLGFFFPVTAVASNPEGSGPVPSKFSLLPNYPNPFNPQTTIEYQLPVTARVTLTVYNTLGQKVTTLVDGVAAPGRYRKVWDGRNAAHQAVASGLYLVTLKAEPVHAAIRQSFQKTRTMVLLR